MGGEMMSGAINVTWRPFERESVAAGRLVNDWGGLRNDWHMLCS